MTIGISVWSSLESQFSVDSEHEGLGTVGVVAGLAPDTALTRWQAALE